MAKYLRPPIVEAYIEVRFATALRQTFVHKVRDKISKSLPMVNANYPIQNLEIQISEIGKPSAEIKGSEGYLLQTEQGDQAVQLQSDLFWFSKKAPYESWEDFFGMFKKYFSLIVRTKKREVTRIGCRFINRFDIPNVDKQPIVLGNYLNMGIGVKENKFKIDGFSSTIEVKLEDEYRARISLTTAPPAIPETGCVLLDIDVFWAQSLGWQEDEILEKINQFQKIKDDLFESLITDKAREIFNRKF